MLGDFERTKTPGHPGSEERKITHVDRNKNWARERGEGETEAGFSCFLKYPRRLYVALFNSLAHRWWGVRIGAWNQLLEKWPFSRINSSPPSRSSNPVRLESLTSRFWNADRNILSADVWLTIRDSTKKSWARYTLLAYSYYLYELEILTITEYLSCRQEYRYSQNW
jgi:hypothetical protein